jgi:hypothetical protein
MLFLLPDLFMLGYLANARFGAALYNFAHTYLAPAMLLAISCFAAKPTLFPVALIWDRAHRIGPDARLRPQIPHALQRHPFSAPLIQ